MPDLTKRRTLKLFGAAPLVSIPAVSSAAQLVDTGASSSTEAAFPPPAMRTSMEMEIQIINSTAVPENNLLLRNHTAEPMTISRFLPGHIVFDGKLLDLNEAVSNETLVLGAGQSRAFHFKVWPLLNAGPVEYVWADHAADVLSDETSVITLGAFMADSEAVVYANTRRFVPS